MTAALIAGIVLIIAIVFFAKPDKKQKALDDRNRNIVNLELQDELFRYYFSKLIDVAKNCIKRNRPEPIDIYVAFLGQYTKYGLKHIYETGTQQSAATENIINLMTESVEEGDYPADDSKLPIEDKIWHFPWNDNKIHADRPDLLLGKPNTSIDVDGIRYDYGSNGVVVGKFHNTISEIFIDLIIKLTQKTLKEYGYNYSYDRQLPLAQKYPAYPSAFKDNPCVLLTDPKDIANYNKYGLEFTPTPELKQRMDAAGTYRIVNPECIIPTKAYDGVCGEIYKRWDIEAMNVHFTATLYTVLGAITTPMSILLFIGACSTKYNAGFIGFGVAVLSIGIVLVSVGLWYLKKGQTEYETAVKRQEDAKKEARK